jgi:hypothetical protein
MAGVLKRCLTDACITVIEIGAVHALVTDTSNISVAVIAKSIVDCIASWTEFCQVECLWIRRWAWNELMEGIMTMLLGCARLADAESFA